MPIEDTGLNSKANSPPTSQSGTVDFDLQQNEAEPHTLTVQDNEDNFSWEFDEIGVDGEKNRRYYLKRNGEHLIIIDTMNPHISKRMANVLRNARQNISNTAE